jgi:hypothetical protein|tara:strand:+ start:594 stop:1034 length:441 start_codon:yes stop_codon:yes gene_type:complete
MASSIYIYETIKDYNKIYKGVRNDPTRESFLIDLFVKDKKLLIVTETSKLKERPELTKSLVHFRNGSLGKYEDGTEKLVHYCSLKFNNRKTKLEIIPRFLRKPELELRVDRFYGDTTKRKINIDYTKRYYDLIFDRINLILVEKNE